MKPKYAILVIGLIYGLASCGSVKPPMVIPQGITDGHTEFCKHLLATP